MPDVQLFDSSGAAARTISLDETVFGGKPNTALLHQAVVRQLANARQGTHDTQTRAEVSRTTKKVWRQKGTGRARQGSRKAPHWRGGGVVFGPHPREHRLELPKKMRQGALRSALATKAAAGEIVVLQDLVMDAPSTKSLRLMLEGVSKARSQLLVLEVHQRNVQLSARNLPHVKAITTENVSVVDILRHEHVVFSLAALRVIEARYAKAGGGPARSGGAPVEGGADADTTTASTAGTTTGGPATEAAPPVEAPATEGRSEGPSGAAGGTGE